MKVLDKGFIEVIDTLGDDLTVVNSARVSFGKRKKKFDDIILLILKGYLNIEIDRNVIIQEFSKI